MTGPSRLPIASLITAAFALSVVVAAGAPTPAVGQPAFATAVGPCGTLSYPPTPPSYSHVVVIMDENLSYAAFKASTQTPYLRSLGSACGSETLMHAATHPSQPNYMAATSGQATAAATRTSNNNIFHQVQVHNKVWKSYEESMTRPCGTSTGFYKTGHNPAFWYDDLRTPVDTCAANDVPMSPALDTAISNDTLPTFSWITPNECDNMHWMTGCPEASSQAVAAGDTWLSALVPRLTALNSYKTGKTLIVITWDEGNGPGGTGVDCTAPAVYLNQPSCQIPTIVVSPYITPGKADGSNQNLYSLLGTVEDVLGYPRLGRAVGQPSMRPGLRF